MKVLNLQSAVTVLRLTSDEPSGKLLTDQVSSLFGQAPNLILDLNGIQLNSMLIGELVNLNQAFTKAWRDRAHRVALVNVTDFSQQTLRSVRLNERLPIYDSVDAALAAFREPASASQTA